MTLARAAYISAERSTHPSVHARNHYFRSPTHELHYGHLAWFIRAPRWVSHQFIVLAHSLLGTEPKTYSLTISSGNRSIVSNNTVRRTFTSEGISIPLSSNKTHPLYAFIISNCNPCLCIFFLHKKLCQ